MYCPFSFKFAIELNAFLLVENALAKTCLQKKLASRKFDTATPNNTFNMNIVPQILYQDKSSPNQCIASCVHCRSLMDFCKSGSLMNPL